MVDDFPTVTTEVHTVPTEREAMTAVDALAPGTRVGRWRVVERLGVGGQGAVYRVEDLEPPGGFHALKLALSAHDRRAEREAVLVTARAVHPHVVRGAAFPGGRPGLVMEWVPGPSLDVWAETEGTTFRRLMRVSATVADTVGELHARGVLHRDLKPEHIRIREPDGQPVLIDFGAGWYAGADPLTTGPLPPATRYLVSPEAVRFLWASPAHPGAHYGFRPTDDLYALGVCLYRATTGHYPFSEFLPMDLLQLAIVQVRPLAPALANPRVPRALSEIIVRLLEKDPAARFPSGEALRAALDAAAREGASDWDEDIFAWEDVPPLREGEALERALLRPSRPPLSWSSAPPALPPVEPVSGVATPPPPQHVARRGHRARWLGLAAAVLLALLPASDVPLDAPGIRAPEDEGSTDMRVDSAPEQSEQAPSPVRNQKRAPCTQGLEVELSGACWLWLGQTPPRCPAQAVAYNDRCFLPVARSQSIPTSMDAGTPEAR